jgi:hypothetical protein
MRALSDKRGRGAAAGQRAAANKLQARDSWAAIMRAVNDESLRPWEDGAKTHGEAITADLSAPPPQVGV